MRVALFTDTYLPDINGVVSSIELLRKKLEEKGHEAYVVSTRPGLFKVKKEGRIIRLPGIELKSLYGYKLASPAHMLVLDELEEMNFDLFHVHTEFGVGIFASIAAKQLHIPLVRTYHTTYEDYTHYVNVLHVESFDKVAKKLVGVLSRQYGDDCLRLIAPSKKTANMLKGYGVSTPISILPTGVELKRFSPDLFTEEDTRRIRTELGIGDDEKMVLYVGRIAQEKSLVLLLEAFKLIKEEGIKAKLVVIGGGPQLEELRSLAKTLSIDDIVIFTDKKPFVEVPAYYHAADLFTSASKTETQGMTYVEALASGTPVLARHDEVLEELIGEGRNGYFFDDKEEFVEKLKQFLSLSGEELKAMQQNALAESKIYDADVYVENMLKLYEETIEEYESSYVVKSISLKNDVVHLTLNNGKNEEKVMVSLETYYQLGIRKDDKLTAAQYERLKNEESFVKAYRAALKRISARDYTVKQMREYLRDKQELPEEEIDEIVEKLEEKGMLDDRRYVIEKRDHFEAILLSRKQMTARLRRAGIAPEIIEECLDSEDSEADKALRRAQKHQKSIRNKSLLVKKQTIKRKLYEEGFSSEDIQEAMSMLDFAEDAFAEESVLKSECSKIRRRLERKYSGTQLRNRLYQSLLAKGFANDAVYALINGMEWEDD
ncbi:MAG: RecX family transcriptional regulator [Erysipelotrichaceae bacterium]|nr:RecX family transcriptional regulator [Erysipelotrichaceae bacterium]